LSVQRTFVLFSPRLSISNSELARRMGEREKMSIQEKRTVRQRGVRKDGREREG
jgi:hypothetical protein